jgi:hypothetical protein
LVILHLGLPLSGSCDPVCKDVLLPIFGSGVTLRRCLEQEVSMTGRVVCFRPRLRRGIVRTECGDELAFETLGDADAIQGDDLVEFILINQDSERKARVTRVVERNVSRGAQFDQFLQEVFGTLNIERTAK